MITLPHIRSYASVDEGFVETDQAGKPNLARASSEALLYEWKSPTERLRISPVGKPGCAAGALHQALKAENIRLSIGDPYINSMKFPKNLI